ncbi:MAG: DUF4412 domain-containing protein [Desulfobacterales bacterium]|nr:DUF4412 domain-containing protein [Desulfobacterales bacterium]MBF0397696.1 DUF4412 domain-containing protein [Desulfobacterales bacterium]
MIKRTTKKLVLISILNILIISGYAFSGQPDNFTAKMVMEGMSMPMAKLGDKTRTENPMMKGMVIIHLGESGKTYVLSSSSKTFTEMPKQEEQPTIYDPRAVIEKKEIGKETIDGHPCIKYDTTFYMKDKPNEKYKAIMWEAQDLSGLPIQNEVTMPKDSPMGGKGGKVVMKLKDIKMGAAKASMFEIPANYKKVNSIMEMMGMGMGGGMHGKHNKKGQNMEGMPDMPDMNEMMKNIPKEAQEMMKQMPKETEE